MKIKFICLVAVLVLCVGIFSSFQPVTASSLSYDQISTADQIQVDDVTVKTKDGKTVLVITGSFPVGIPLYVKLTMTSGNTISRSAFSDDGRSLVVSLDPSTSDVREVEVFDRP